MTKLALIVGLLALLGAALSIAGLVTPLVPQGLAALALCVLLFNVIAQGERTWL